MKPASSPDDPAHREDDLLTREQAISLLRLNETHRAPVRAFQRLCRRDGLRTFRLGRSVRIHCADLEKFIERRRKVGR